MNTWRYAALLIPTLVLACGPSTGEPELGEQPGTSDDFVDNDGDGFGPTSDCDDEDASVYPGAPESADGIDNDCNGQVDDQLPGVDDDGDGYSENDGDCDDSEPMVSPTAVEVGTIIDDNGEETAEGVDNDCDGNIDETVEPCDSGLSVSSAGDYARAMELCDWIEGASFNSDMDSQARNILGGFGNSYVPAAGTSFAVLSTGVAVDASSSDHSSPNGGTSFSNSAPHPDPQGDPGDSCGQADPTSVNDYVELTLDIEVPSNAQALSYDFNFMSGEFPEFVCTKYDDTFMAILESSSFTGNISFDAQGRPVTINVGFFDVCDPSAASSCAGDADLEGTGHEDGVGGGTGWLTTTAPVTPGEVITLRFIIFDEGDRIYDSVVLLDNFRWQGTPIDDPITVERTHVEHKTLEDSKWAIDE